ncbi:DoxX family protein [Sphingorhabdus sp. IMCC26285]|jgi:putative oxidoreductase|uniref:DoxX family protein n=1 Tax=Sphingorhabdus profundilacus TaxID=2509718 RepID=A0A6I4LW56_9SPHN|nr:DoxX family protein [Sphingorhabdus profundilacus]MVZ97109.1 DoxX family protein [Sphingorhabdus profundilacus]
MNALSVSYHRIVAMLSSMFAESAMLLFVRFSLAGIFWRSGRTKVEDGSWLSVSDTAKFLFKEEYSNVPLPPELASYLATYAEHLFPALLVIGLLTRVSALALLGMTMVIQIFVYPEAWWSVHMIWVALALVLIVRGGGKFSADAILTRSK